MNPQTPIRGMDEHNARAALGPAITRMREAEARLPKTIEASQNMDAKSLTRMTNDWIVSGHNVSLLVQQIIETTDDPALSLIEL